MSNWHAELTKYLLYFRFIIIDYSSWSMGMTIKSSLRIIFNTTPNVTICRRQFQPIGACYRPGRMIAFLTAHGRPGRIVLFCRIARMTRLVICFASATQLQDFRAPSSQGRRR